MSRPLEVPQGVTIESFQRKRKLFGFFGPRSTRTRYIASSEDKSGMVVAYGWTARRAVRNWGKAKRVHDTIT